MQRRSDIIAVVVVIVIIIIIMIQDHFMLHLLNSVHKTSVNTKWYNPQTYCIKFQNYTEAGSMD
jgi:uncharacterized membrane protein